MSLTFSYGDGALKFSEAAHGQGMPRHVHSYLFIIVKQDRTSFINSDIFCS